MHNANVTWNFALHSTPWENAKLKYSEISTPQNHQMKMQLKHSVLCTVHRYFCLLSGFIAFQSTVSADKSVTLGLGVGLTHYKLFLGPECYCAKSSRSANRSPRSIFGWKSAGEGGGLLSMSRMLKLWSFHYITLRICNVAYVNTKRTTKNS